MTGLWHANGESSVTIVRVRQPRLALRGLCEALGKACNLLLLH